MDETYNLDNVFDANEWDEIDVADDAPAVLDAGEYFVELVDLPIVSINSANMSGNKVQITARVLDGPREGTFARFDMMLNVKGNPDWTADNKAKFKKLCKLAGHPDFPSSTNDLKKSQVRVRINAVNMSKCGKWPNYKFTWLPANSPGLVDTPF